jgi:hypothetical protein
MLLLPCKRNLSRTSISCDTTSEHPLHMARSVLSVNEGLFDALEVRDELVTCLLKSARWVPVAERSTWSISAPSFDSLILRSLDTRLTANSMNWSMCPGSEIIESGSMIPNSWQGFATGVLAQTCMRQPCRILGLEDQANCFYTVVMKCDVCNPYCFLTPTFENYYVDVKR